MVEIRDLVEPVRTWNPATKPEDTFDYVDLSAISQAEKRILAPTPTRGADAPSRARQLIREGDILVSTVRPNLNGVGPVTVDFDGATASTGFCVLRPRAQKLASDYLMHWVRSPPFVDQMVRQATGASYPAVSDRIIKASAIPLPPLDEQRRIAAILDKADALRRKRKRALELARELGNGIFSDLFGSLLHNEKNWPTVSISSACEFIVDCVNRTAPIVDFATPYKMIRTNNVRNGNVDLSAVRYVDEDTFVRWNRRATPRRGDLLLTREAPVGGVGILASDDNVFLGQRLMLYRSNRNVMTPEFLSYTFKSKLLLLQFDQMSSGSTVKHLPLPACRAFQIRLPPIALQEKFSSAMALITASATSSERALGELGSLFASLQHRAFSGQL